MRKIELRLKICIREAHDNLFRKQMGSHKNIRNENLPRNNNCDLMPFVHCIHCPYCNTECDVLHINQNFNLINASFRKVFSDELFFQKHKDDIESFT